LVTALRAVSNGFATSRNRAGPWASCPMIARRVGCEIAVNTSVRGSTGTHYTIRCNVSASFLGKIGRGIPTAPTQPVPRCWLVRGCRLRAILWRGRAGAREIHLGHFARALGCGEVGFIGLEPGPSCENAARKLLDVSVVVLERIVVTLTFDGDPVFGAREFILQAEEVFV